jgi:hypothetical protein
LKAQGETWNRHPGALTRIASVPPSVKAPLKAPRCWKSLQAKEAHQDRNCTEENQNPNPQINACRSWRRWRGDFGSTWRRSFVLLRACFFLLRPAGLLGGSDAGAAGGAELPGQCPAGAAGGGALAIAAHANPKYRPAIRVAAKSLPENNFSVDRHPRLQAAFDNGCGSCRQKKALPQNLWVRRAAEVDMEAASPRLVR